MDIYLDHASTTPISNDLLEHLKDKLEFLYGNPSSLHRKGMEAERAIKHSREAISKLMRVKEKEIVFTSGGTEANNLAILGTLTGSKLGRVLYSAIEHPSVIGPMDELKKMGYDVQSIPVLSNGLLDLQAFKNLLTEDTCFVSVMHVNNEIGSVQPIGEIAKLIKDSNHKVIFHVDAIQSFGKILIDPKDMGIDLMSFSGHKIGALKGSGGLFIREGLQVKPRAYGGQQENGLRPGTENTIGIIALGLAASNAMKNIKSNFHYVQELKNKMIDLLNDVPEVAINGNGESPYILNVSILGTKGEIMLHTLEMSGVYVSTGAACSSKKTYFSHVLKAIGCPETHLESAIRLSFGPSTTEEDIINAANAIACAARDLRMVIGQKKKRK